MLSHNFWLQQKKCHPRLDRGSITIDLQYIDGNFCKVNSSRIDSRSSSLSDESQAPESMTFAGMTKNNIQIISR